MARYYTGNHSPLGHWKNIPIYLTTILTAVLIAGVVANVLIDTMRSAVGLWLIFTMPLVPAWSLWRLVTYVLIDQISFFTPFALLFFYWASVGIETHLGRVVLTKLLLLLALTSPAVCVVWWALGIPSGAAGNYVFMGGLIVAFATLYPNTEAWGWIPFKWMAFACIVCGSLMLLADRNWVRLSQLWASCVVGFAYINHAKEMEHDDYESPLLRFAKRFRRQPKFRVLPSPSARSRRVEAPDEVESIDPLLDKIARSGMNSLTAKERARLEKAREALLKKDHQ